MAFSIAPQPIDSQLSSYDYLLPPDRIAQNPVVPRDRSRLLVVNSPHSHEHQWFYQIPHWLKPGDLLVLNNTQVIPARLRGHKLVDAGSLGAGPGLTGSGLGAGPGLGAEVEVLLLEALGDDRWLTLVKPGRRLKPGAQIIFTPPQADGGSAADRGATATVPDRTAPNLTASALTASALTATVLATDIPTGGRVLQFSPPPNTSLWDCFQTLGEVPIPPYITASQATPDQYQTVYSSQPGAVAAPTAGLHFTPELLAQLQAQGIEQAQITLHVGVGTFRPVEVENINHHAMHGEWIEISPETVAKIHETQSRGGRIIAVGTTVVRALEGAAALGTLQPYQGKVNLFIHPGYPWQVVEGLVTNFHLPRSSLMMLVSALVGRQRLLDLYALAIEHHYRFYSFGDAMVILPEARPSFSA